MTRNRGSWSGSRFLGTKIIRRLQNTEVAATGLTYFSYFLCIQDTPYKSAPRMPRLRKADPRVTSWTPGGAKPAPAREKPIGMSVLVAPGGSSYHACSQP